MITSALGNILNFRHEREICQDVLSLRSLVEKGKDSLYLYPSLNQSQGSTDPFFYVPIALSIPLGHLPPPLLLMRPLEILWANHSEKLRDQPYEPGAAMTQSITDTRNIQGSASQDFGGESTLV